MGFWLLFDGRITDHLASGMYIWHLIYGINGNFLEVSITEFI